MAREIENLRERTARIRALNDALRTTFVGGVVTVTQGFEQLDYVIRAKFLALVRDFATFNNDNDPDGEHDFGSVTVNNIQVLWKIDYYDRTLLNGSNDPAEPDQTTRVLTVMLASEY